jgi:hypothetical protein
MARTVSNFYRPPARDTSVWEKTSEHLSLILLPENRKWALPGEGTPELRPVFLNICTQLMPGFFEGKAKNCSLNLTGL